jgi:hypothetical protein
MNGGYRYESYWEVFRRHGFRPKEPVAYPMESSASGAAKPADDGCRNHQKRRPTGRRLLADV